MVEFISNIKFEISICIFKNIAKLYTKQDPHLFEVQSDNIDKYGHG